MQGKYKQAVNHMNEKSEVDTCVKENENSIDEILEEAGLDSAEDTSRQPDIKEQQLQEAKEKMLRLHADFDNFRKRTNKEKEEWFQYASLNILEKILPVIDNLERALSSLNQQSEETQNLFAGILMTYRQLLEVLQKEGLEAITPVGQIFDPTVHEAIMQVPVEDGQEDNQVVEELRRGYRFKDKVIRPSLVKVAKK